MEGDAVGNQQQLWYGEEKKRADCPHQGVRMSEECKNRGLTAAAVIIGNEILSGSVEDVNTPFLLKELRALGVCLKRICVLPDEIEVISVELQKAAAEFDFVFTSGGIGPTHDDVTIAAVAHAIGVEVVYSDRLLDIMNLHLGDRLNEPLKKMARIPEGAELVFDGDLVFPLVAIRNIYILPGVPELFREKFQSIRERLRAEPFFVTRFLLKAGEGEIADPLCRAAEAFPGVQMGSYPIFRHPDYRVRLVLESRDEEILRQAAKHLRAMLAPEWIYKVE